MNTIRRSIAPLALITALSAAIPWYFLLQYLTTKSATAYGMLAQATANVVAQSSLADLVLSAIVVSYFIVVEGRNQSVRYAPLFIVPTFLVGVGFGLGCFLIAREFYRTERTPPS